MTISTPIVVLVYIHALLTDAIYLYMHHARFLVYVHLLISHRVALLYGIYIPERAYGLRIKMQAPLYAMNNPIRLSINWNSNTPQTIWTYLELYNEQPGCTVHRLYNTHKAQYIYFQEGKQNPI